MWGACGKELCSSCKTERKNQNCIQGIAVKGDDDQFWILHHICQHRTLYSQLQLSAITCETSPFFSPFFPIHHHVGFHVCAWCEMGRCGRWRGLLEPESGPCVCMYKLWAIVPLSSATGLIERVVSLPRRRWRYVLFEHRCRLLSLCIVGSWHEERFISRRRGLRNMLGWQVTRNTDPFNVSYIRNALWILRHLTFVR